MTLMTEVKLYCYCPKNNRISLLSNSNIYKLWQIGIQKNNAMKLIL